MSGLKQLEMINLAKQPWMTEPLTRPQKQILMILLQDIGLRILTSTWEFTNHDKYPGLGSISYKEYEEVSGYRSTPVPEDRTSDADRIYFRYEELVNLIKNKQYEEINRVSDTL
jgi:hypothetical protein